jgi:hypothetical protein
MLCAVNFTSHPFHVELGLDELEELPLSIVSVLLSADDFQNFAGEVLSTVVADGDAQEILAIVIEGIPYVGFPSNLG